MNYSIPILPLEINLETNKILKKLISAKSALTKLDGISNIIPNKEILINTLSLQEAKNSSLLENIITTDEDLYSSDSFQNQFKSIESKEVYRYTDALKAGYQLVKKHQLLTNNYICEIQRILKESDGKFRRVPGTNLTNDATGEIIYTPPQDYNQIIKLMTNLELFINDDSICDLDPLIKMAIIHHQFESIHPFGDGNGRTGRIINVLYLVKKDLLQTPILYLSRYINEHKSEYYRLLQAVRDDFTQTAWENWVLYLLSGIEETSLQGISLIQNIKDLMQSHKNTMRDSLKRIYSQDLLNATFNYPYTTRDILQRELDISRTTATSYLDKLCNIGLASKIKRGRENYYINTDLVNVLSSVNA